MHTGVCSAGHREVEDRPNKEGVSFGEHIATWDVRRVIRKQQREADMGSFGIGTI
jgi:hypothetical protein